MSDRQGYINLQDPIHLYIDASEQSNHKFYKLWNLAVSAMEQLGLDAFFGVRTVVLPVSGAKTVTLPADCLQWGKVGYFNGRGEIVSLGRNKKLSNYAALHPERIEKLKAGGVDLTSDVFHNYAHEGAVVHLYGTPPAQPMGTFNVDEEQGVVILSPDCPLQEIALEYIPAVDQSVDLYIPIQFKEAVKWYLAWQDIAFLPNTRKGTLGDKEQRRRNFFNERRLALARYKPFRPQEAIDQNRDSQRKTIKS
jgi:hypothetical protein